MESINLNNYEAYFLDFLEGTLSAKDEAAMYAFLDTHPKLKSEFVDLTGMPMADLTLKVNEKSSISTESLKAEPSILSPMTVDQWMVSSVENQLTESQNAQLLNYIAQHKLESKFVAYQATILNPQAGDAYGDKSGLKRKPASVIPMWMKFSSAAAAVAILVFLVSPGEGETEIAEEVPVNSINVQSADFRSFYAELPRAVELNDVVNDNNTFEVIQYDDNNIVRQEKVEDFEKIDSSNTIIPKIDLPDNIVEENPIDTAKTIIENQVPDLDDDNIAVDEKTESNKNSDKTIEEEPYRLFTDAASNVTNRQVSFKRTLNTESDEYVAYHFKIGKFEFDRKKRSK